MKQTFSKIFICLLACCSMALSSCNSENDDPGTGTARMFIDIVTYEAGSEQGASFTFRQNGDSQLITLTTSQRLDAGFKVGSRVVIQYSPESGRQYQSGPVTLFQVLHAAGDGEEIPAKTAEQTSNWRSNPIKIQSISRSGTYLDFTFIGSMGNRNINPTACVDAATVDSDYPVVHIIFGPDDSFTDKEYLFFGSYSMAELWNKPTCKGIMVYFKNETNTDKHVQLDKVSGSITPSN